MNELKGKVAVVTGASKGIGASIAKALGAAGASVVVNYASSQEGAQKVVDEIVRKDGKAIAVQGDMSKAADVKRLFAQTQTTFGRLDVLVNNAGVFKFGPLESVAEEDFHWHFNTNVVGPLLTLQESLKHFGKDGGSVVNVSSVVATSGPAGGSVYSATKGALDAITSAMSAELGSRKIRVNTVSPGLTNTEGARAGQFMGSEFEKQVVAATPLGRSGEPEDIALAVVFLASEASRWVTGEIIRVSGGLR